MAVTAQERLYLLSQVNQLAQTQLSQLWTQADQLSDTDFAATVVEAFPQLADPFVSMSGDLAASWFELSDPASDYVASTAPLPEAEKLTASAEWALGATGDAGKDRLAGTLQRAVFNGARDTINLNIIETDSRWVRVARPEACAFCKLMATRSENLYHSAHSAKYVVGRRGRARGTQDIGDKFHDHCHCQPLEVRGPENYAQVDPLKEWNDTREKAHAEAGTGDLKSVLSAWRRIDGSA